MQTQLFPRETELPLLQRRLWQSACLAVPLLLLSLVSLPVCAAAQLALTAPLFFLHRSLFAEAWRQLRGRAPGRELLPALCAALAGAYNLAAVALAWQGLAWQRELTPAAGVVLTLSAAGRYWELRLLTQAAAPLQSPAPPLPSTACLLRDGRQETIPAADLREGDLFLVRPGEPIPADGVVCEGVSTLEESVLTGRAAPVDKFPGSTVYAGTRNRDGALTCCAMQVGGAAALARVHSLGRAAAGGPAFQTGQTERAARLLILAALGLAALTLALWWALGAGFGAALGHALAVLAAACPGAVCLGTPAALLAAGAQGLSRGLLFRSAAALEGFGRTRTVLLDKDGTITGGDPAVVQIVGTRKVPAKFLLGMAAGLELRCTSPEARAILKKAEEERIAYSRLTDFEELPGQGLRGKLAGKVLAGGSRAFIAGQCELPPDLLEAGERLEGQGARALYFSLAGHAAGVIAVSEEVKTTSKPAIAALRELGLEVRLLAAGDGGAAAHLAELAGLDEAHVISGVSLDGQAAEVERLQAGGPVALAAARDSEALGRADTGVYLGAQDIPDAAGLVLLRGELADLADAVRLSRRAQQTARQSLRAALAYNGVGLALAAVLLGPVAAAAAAALAGAAVVWYAVRAFRPETEKTAEGGSV